MGKSNEFVKAARVFSNFNVKLGQKNLEQFQALHAKLALKGKELLPYEQRLNLVAQTLGADLKVPEQFDKCRAALNSLLDEHISVAKSATRNSPFQSRLEVIAKVIGVNLKSPDGYAKCKKILS